LISWVHEQHRGVGGAPALVDQPGDGALVGEVEREQRLVAEQDVGIADEGLRHPEPLLLTAGQASDRRVCIRRTADGGECRVHPCPTRPAAAQADAQPMPVEAQPDEIAPARRQVRVQCLLLRQVADTGVAAPRRASGDADLAGRERQQAEHYPHQGGLARTVRAEYRDELARRDVQVAAPARRSGMRFSRSGGGAVAANPTVITVVD